MSILKVARMGHPVLRAKARALDKATVKSPAMQKLNLAAFDKGYQYGAELVHRLSEVEVEEVPALEGEA